LARPDPACGLGGRVGFEEGAFEAGGEDLAGGGGAGYAGTDYGYAFSWLWAWELGVVRGRLMVVWNAGLFLRWGVRVGVGRVTYGL
jgi:hypothetical protein